MVDAAINIIAEKGLGGLILGDVAARAGYSATLPLHYYKSKEALILHTARRILADYDEVMQKELAETSGLDAIIRFIHTYFRYALAAPGKRRAFFMITSEAAVSPSLQKSIAELTRVGASNLSQLIRNGQRAGEIEPLIDPDTFGMLILGWARGAISLWVVDPELDLHRMASAMAGSVVRILRHRDAGLQEIPRAPAGTRE